MNDINVSMDNELNFLGFLQRKFSCPGKDNDLLAIESLQNKSWKIRKLSADYLVSRGDAVFPCIAETLKKPQWQSFDSSTGSPNDNSDNIIDSSMDMLYWLMTILSRIKNPASLSIIQSFCTHNEKKIRYCAFQSLADHAAHNSELEHDEIVLNDIINTFITGLYDTEQTIKETAVKGLENIGNPSVNPVLDSFETLPDTIKFEAIRLVARITGPEGLNIISEKLGFFSSELIFYKIAALGEINTPESIKQLINYLSNPSRFVQEFAAECIEKSGSAALKELKNAIKSKDITTKYWSIILFGKIFKSGSVKYISRFLEDSDINIQYYAINALGRTGSSNAVPVLVSCLKKKNLLLQNYAFKMICMINEKSIPFLNKSLKDPGLSDIHHWIIKALSSMGNKGLRVLISKFSHLSSSGRIMLFDSLIPSPNKGLILFLIKCLKDKEWIIRKKSADLLIKIGPPAAVYVKKACSSEYRDQRYWASKTAGLIEEDSFKFVLSLIEQKKYESALKALKSLRKNVRIFENIHAFDKIINALYDCSSKCARIYCEILSMGNQILITRLMEILKKANNIESASNNIVATSKSRSNNSEDDIKDNIEDKNNFKEIINYNKIKKWIYLALGMSQNPMAEPILIESFKKDTENRLCIYEALTLMSIFEKSLEFTHQTFLNEPDLAAAENYSFLLAESSFENSVISLLTKYDSASYSERKKIDMFIEKSKNKFPGKVIMHVKKNINPQNRVFFSLISNLDKDLRTTILLPYIDTRDHETRIKALKMLNNTDDSRLIIKLFEKIDNHELTHETEQQALVEIFNKYDKTSQIKETLLLMDINDYKILNNWLNNADHDVVHHAVQIQNGIKEDNLKKFGISLSIEEEKEIIKTHEIKDLLNIPYFRLIKVTGNIMGIPYGIIESSTEITDLKSLIITVKEYLNSSEKMDKKSLEIWFRRNCIKNSGL